MDKRDKAQMRDYERIAAAIRKDNREVLASLVSRSKANRLSKALSSKPSLHDPEMDGLGLLNMASSCGAKDCVDWMLGGGCAELVEAGRFNPLMAACESRQVELIELFSQHSNLGDVDEMGRNAYDVYFSRPEIKSTALRSMARMSATESKHAVFWTKTIDDCLSAGHADGLEVLLDEAPKETWSAEDLIKKLCSKKRNREVVSEF